MEATPKNLNWEKHCPHFQKGRGKEKLQKLYGCFRFVRQSQHLPRAQALEPCCLNSSNVTVDTLLTTFAYQFPHLKMEIKTIPASMVVVGISEFIYVKHFEHYWYLSLC